MRTYHLVCIIDRSGSMSGLEEDTIGGYNSFLESQKYKENTLVTTIFFDHEFIMLYNQVPLAQAYLSKNQYQVRGSTALLDAIGHSIEVTNHARNFEDNTQKTIYIITTDGQENASTRFTYREIHRLIEAEQEKGHDFVFLGANIDVKTESSKLGIKKEYSKQYESTNKGTKEMFHQMSNMVDKMMDSE